MTIFVKYYLYNDGMMSCVEDGMMRSVEIENLINEHNERVRQERNEMLRARLARPCSSEELLIRIGSLSDCMPRHGEGQIPLTNSCPQYIM